MGVSGLDGAHLNAPAPARIMGVRCLLIEPIMSLPLLSSWE